MSKLHFLTALRQYLESLAGAPPPPDQEPAISDAWARELVIRTFERVERGESTNARILENLGFTLQYWQTEDRGVRFIRRLDQLLRGSFAESAPLSERKRLLEVGLCLRLDIPAQLSTAVRTLTMLQLAQTATDEILGNPSYDHRNDEGMEHILHQFVSDYALAIRAVRNTAHGIVITPIGQVFLDLQGRDAVRWLLRLEVHQSTGPRDPTLIDRSFVQWFLQETTLFIDDEDDEPSIEALRERLQDMGVLSGVNDGPRGPKVELLPLGKELLTELLQPEDPLALLAAALCSDQLGAAVGKAEGRDRASSMLAAEANARQARAVAHEIRNTLLPVQTQLGLLYKDVQSSLGAEALTKRRAVIDKNLERTFKYVEELVQVATLTAAPPSFFEPRAALLEAVQSAEQPGGPALDVSGVVSPLPVLSGHRERFVLALVNLLRNALQHGGSGTLHVRVSAQPEDGEKWLRITIDDNGSGVPAGEREAIFAQSYSRSSSGTGLGLHIVREVIEDELHGNVRCEDSPLGGARFSLRLPSAGTRSAQKH